LIHASFPGPVFQYIEIGARWKLAITIDRCPALGGAVKEVSNRIVCLGLEDQDPPSIVDSQGVVRIVFQSYDGQLIMDTVPIGRDDIDYLDFFQVGLPKIGVQIIWDSVPIGIIVGIVSIPVEIFINGGNTIPIIVRVPEVGNSIRIRIGQVRTGIVHVPVHIHIDEPFPFKAIVQAIVVLIGSQQPNVCNPITVPIMAFYGIGYIVIVAVRIHIVGNAIPVRIDRDQTEVPINFIGIVQTIVVGIDQTWGNIVRNGLGLDIVRDSVIVTVNVQIIRYAIPIGVRGIGGGVIVPVQVEVFEAVQDAIPVGIENNMGIDQYGNGGR